MAIANKPTNREDEELRRIYDAIEQLNAKAKEIQKGPKRRESLLAYCVEHEIKRTDLSWVYQHISGVRSPRTTSVQPPPQPPSQNLDYFGKKLRELRLAKKLTSDELAVKLGLSTAMISGWERGRWRPKPKHLDAMEKILGGKLPPLGPKPFVARQFPSSRRPLPDHVGNEIWKMWDGGKGSTMRNIAKKFHLSLWKVRFYLSKRRGMTTSGRYLVHDKLIPLPEKGQRRVIPDNIVKEMREKAAAGETLNELSKHYGISWSVVKRVTSQVTT